MFRKTKRQHNINTIKQACKDPTGAEFYKMIKQLEPRLNKKARQFTLHSKEAEEETERIAEQFENIFGQTDVKPTKTERDRLRDNLRNIKERIQKENNPPFTTRELEQAVRRAETRSAKGHDWVSNRLIKIAFDVPDFAEQLLFVINKQIMEIGKYPTELKTAKIIPLPKANPGEFRPISLLPSLSNIIEYMIQNRMREILEPKLPRNQFGCRPGYSTTQALMRLMHYSGYAAGTNQKFGIILYDFTKAYDRVPKHTLVKKMIELNTPAYLINIIHDWLTNRQFTVTYRQHESRIRNQENGIPQGSSLSVLLWILFVYDIPLNPKFSNTYVDDTVGWATGHDRRDVETRLKYQLKKMIKWCEKNKIKINTDKTHVLFNE